MGYYISNVHNISFKELIKRNAEIVFLNDRGYRPSFQFSEMSGINPCFRA